MKRNCLKKMLKSKRTSSTLRKKKVLKNSKTERSMMNRSTNSSNKEHKKTKMTSKMHKKATKMSTAMLLHFKTKASPITNQLISAWSISRSKRPSTSS